MWALNWTPVNPALSITPSRGPPYKVQRTNNVSGVCNHGHPQPKQHLRISFQGNNSQGRQSGGEGGRSSWGHGAWGNPRTSVPTCSSLIDFLAQGCEKYCAPFQVRGLSFEDDDCKLRHLHFCVVGKWGEGGTTWICWKKQEPNNVYCRDLCAR